MPDHRPHPRLKWHNEMVQRQQIFVVPGDSSGSGTLKPMGKTWGMRVSGDVDKLVPHEYCCPVHGRFTVQVRASDVPDAVECHHEYGNRIATCVPPRYVPMVCRHRSPWAGSSCAIGIEPGMVTG